MKGIKIAFLAMHMLAMAFCFTSCSEDNIEPEPTSPLEDTRWEYIEKYTSSGVSYTFTYSISFSGYNDSAYYTVDMEAVSGSQTLTDSESVSYTYSYSDPLVVLTPTSAGKAYLEGTISSGIKMVVKNTSTGKTIGTFYKK